jgi:hypothetical protein
MIRYRRGHVTVLERGELGGKTCEGYQIVENEFERLLGAGGQAK